MTENVQSYIDMLRNFAGGLGLPKLDVDKLIETHRKNIDALAPVGGDRGRGRPSGGEKTARDSRCGFARGLDSRS